jgi:cyclopropane-fatty-acyl-phospholipid synthase
MRDAGNSRAAKVVAEVIQVIGPRFGVTLWDGSTIGPADGVRLKVNDAAALGALARKPDISTVVELWASGIVDVEGGTLFDLVEVRPEGRLKDRLKALPKWRLLAMMPGLLLSRPPADAGLAGRNWSVSGSDKDAITHHYDVSNDFYRLFLDERMVYTCGYFETPDATLDAAQRAKLDLVCRKLRLKPGERLLDIGCGWGAMLIHAAEHYGVTGVGVSLSEAQTALARERIAAKGLSDRITIHVMSYAELGQALNLDGTFDKVSSIGMFEAVGIKNYDTYFSSVQRFLKPGGLYLHHAITRRMKRTKSAFARKSAEHRALVKYIFPGGELDHLGMTIGNLEGHGFEVHDAENLRVHYGKTCRIWAERLGVRMEEAAALVGAPRARIWLLYLTGCALAFERGTVQINQTLASKRKRGLEPVPLTRADLYTPKG